MYVTLFQSDHKENVKYVLDLKNSIVNSKPSQLNKMFVSCILIIKI